MLNESFPNKIRTINKQLQDLRDARQLFGTHPAVYIMAHIAWQAGLHCQRGPCYCVVWHGAHVYIGEMMANILAATCARHPQHWA